MNHNTLRRLAVPAVCIAAVAVLLTACGTRRSEQTTVSSAATSSTGTPALPPVSGPQDSSHTSGTHGVPGTSGVPGSSGIPGTSGIPGSSGGSGTSGEAGLQDAMTPDTQALERAVVRFNGADYRLSPGEQLRRDEIGARLLLVQRVVDRTENDGDAVSLPKGTRVYAILDNTDHSAVAVELNGTYYRANRAAE